MVNKERIKKKFLHCTQLGPTVIYEDNYSSIDMLSGKTRLSTKSKHINWRYQYALQAITELTAYMKWIEGDNQIADILTKYVKAPKQFYFLRSELINCSNTESGY
jgi:hypothetical protein